MGVKVRQKGGKWYVFINHQGQRKAKCIGSDKRVAVQVQKQLENPASRLGKYLPEKRFDSDKVIDPFTSAELERYMSKELRTAFLDLKTQRFDAAILQGRTTIPSGVFCTDAGRPWDSKRIYFLHKRVCTMAGSRVTRVHDLRHSYATIQLYELHAPIPVHLRTTGPCQYQNSHRHLRPSASGYEYVPGRSPRSRRRADATFCNPGAINREYGCIISH